MRLLQDQYSKQKVKNLELEGGDVLVHKENDTTRSMRKVIVLDPEIRYDNKYETPCILVIDNKGKENKLYTRRLNQYRKEDG